MPLFTIPASQENLDELAALGDRLGMETPRCWRHTDLHRTLGELVAMPPSDERPADFAADARLCGLAEPLILFCNDPHNRVNAVIRAYKETGRWPVFAVITRHSIHMTLAILLEHLLHDRRTEANLRQASTKAPPA